MAQKIWNSDFVDALNELETISKNKGEPFRARAYKTASDTILAMPEEIRENLNSYSTSFQSPHLFISGPIGVGKTTAWKLVARQLLGPTWKTTS